MYSGCVKLPFISTRRLIKLREQIRINTAVLCTVSKRPWNMTYCSWLFSTSKSGYMDSELFHQWFIKICVPNCGPARPVIVLMDNHDSHISLPLKEKAREEQVLQVGLLSHTTHYLRLLDVHIIGPVKEKVNSLASNVCFSKPHIAIGKARLSVLVSYAIDQTPHSTVKEEFRLAGILPVNPDVIQESQLVPPTFTPNDHQNDSEPIRICETCGQLIGQNPLLQWGMIPASLADILAPPPVKQQTENQKRKVETSGRVISGDEILKVLKEREDAEVKREEKENKQKVVKDSKREQKELEQVKKLERKQKKDQERSEKEQAMLKEKEKKKKVWKLVEKKYMCGVYGDRGRVHAELCGIQWYCCDNEVCKSTGWFHFDCLSDGERAVLRESLEDEDVSWYCELCFPKFHKEK